MSPRALPLLLASCAAVVAIGGAMGYAKAGSVVSLAAAGAAALLWWTAAYGTWRGARWGRLLALTVAVVLGVAMGARYVTTGSTMPAVPVVVTCAVVVGAVLWWPRARANPVDS